MKQNIPASQWGASRVVLALAWAGSCAFAQTDAPEIELPPVTASAHHGDAIPYDQTGVSVSVLDVPQLRKEGVYTLNEALTTVPGVFVMPGGGDNQRGNGSNTSIRGISSGTAILPMVDGMRVFSTTGGCNLTPNLVSRMNTFDLGNIEVLRGSHGAIYGDGAMGGVIYMETPEGKGAPTLSLFNEYGSFDSYTGNLTAQGKQGKLSFFLSSTYEHTNNDLRCLDGAGPAVKHGGRYANWADALRLDYALNEDNKITLTYRREDAKYRRAYRYDINNWYTGETLAKDLTANPLHSCRTNLVTAKLQSKVNQRYSTSLMVGYYGNDTTFSYDQCANNSLDYNLRNVQVEWRNSVTWNKKNRTFAGFSWNRSDYVSTQVPGEGKTPDSSLENIYGLFAEHAYQPVKNWENSWAFRLDQSSLFDSLMTYRAATSYKFNKEKTRAYASFGRGYRAPGSMQHSRGTFNTPWGIYRGNPDLVCERSYSADLGVEQEIAQDHLVSATLFWEQKSKAIATRYDYVSSWYNADGHWTSQGVELALKGTLEHSWNTGYTVAFTYTQPKTNDDQQVPYTARQLWSADIHTSPVKGLTTGIGLTGAVHRTGYAAGQNLDSYCTLRWYAQYELNEHLSFHIRVENLTDQKFIAEPSYYGNDYSFLNPGTAVYGGCTIQF